MPLSIIDYRQGHQKTRIPEALLIILVGRDSGPVSPLFFIFFFLFIQSIPAGSGLRCVLGQCQLNAMTRSLTTEKSWPDSRNILEWRWPLIGSDNPLILRATHVSFACTILGNEQKKKKRKPPPGPYPTLKMFLACLSAMSAWSPCSGCNHPVCG